MDYSQDRLVEWRDGRQRMNSDPEARLLVEKDPQTSSQARQAKDNPDSSQQTMDTKKNEEPTKEESEAKIPTAPSFNSPYILENYQDNSMIPVANESLVSQGLLPRLNPVGYRFFGMDIIPAFSATQTYNDNIYLRSGKPGYPKESDWISTFSPQISISTKNADDVAPEFDSQSFSLSTSPYFLFFQKHTSENSIDQNVSMRFDKKFTKLSFFVSQTYTAQTGGNVEVASLQTLDIYNTDAGLEYALTPKVSLETVGKLVVRDYDIGFDSYDASGNMWINYELTPKMRIGLGPGYGVVDVTQSANQTYQNGNIRVIYSVSEKTSAFAELGFERRAFEHSSLTSYNWTLNAGASWYPAPYTDVELKATRGQQSSNAFLDQNLVSSAGSITLKQKFHDFLEADFSMGYGHSDYVSTISSVSSGRHDDSLEFSPSIRYSPWEWWDIGASYGYRRNFSSIGINGFENQTWEVSSTVRF